MAVTPTDVDDADKGADSTDGEDPVGSGSPAERTGAVPVSPGEPEEEMGVEELDGTSGAEVGEDVEVGVSEEVGVAGSEVGVGVGVGESGGGGGRHFLQ